MHNGDDEGRPYCVKRKNWLCCLGPLLRGMMKSMQRRIPVAIYFLLWFSPMLCTLPDWGGHTSLLYCRVVQEVYLSFID